MRIHCLLLSKMKMPGSSIRGCRDAFNLFRNSRRSTEYDVNVTKLVMFQALKMQNMGMVNSLRKDSKPEPKPTPAVPAASSGPDLSELVSALGGAFTEVSVTESDHPDAEKIESLLTITKLVTVFESHESVDHAIQTFLSN